MKKTLVNLFLSSIVAGLLCGCATSHPDDYSAMRASSALPQPDNHQALVYVYSRELPLGKKFNVWANGKLAASDMACGKFFYFHADPGEMRIASRGKLTGLETPLLYAYYGAFEARKLERVVFPIEAGETYYVNMHNGFARETMDLVTKEKGERKIQDCRWAGALSDQ